MRFRINLDRLVKEGTTFNNAYNMGAWNGAVCLASRAKMNSGDLFGAKKCLLNGTHENIDSLVFRMQNAGYDTYMTGKWHVGTDAQNTFNHVVNVRLEYQKMNL